MDARWRLPKILLSVGAAALSASCVHGEQTAFRFHQPHVLGAGLDLTATTPSRAAAFAAVEAARAEIDRLELLLSGWRSDSELAGLNTSSGGVVSDDLFNVLQLAEDWRKRTDGAFDGRLGAVEALWRAAASAGRPVDMARSRGLAEAARTACVRLDPARRAVVRPEATVFALDGVAKGYIVDRALEAARRAAPEMTGLMIDIGGDLRCWGQAPRSTGWTVAAADPRGLEDNAAPAALLHIRDGAVATSGAGPRDLLIGGLAYPHLFAAGAGRPARNVATATVFAPTAADADALATALAVMPPGPGLAVIEQTPFAEALIIEAGGARHVSSGWSTLASAVGAPARLIRAAATAAAPWPSGFAVTIDYELLRPTGARIYSPYVVIWVTDEENRLVRALTMLGDDLDWINQNYVWWRRFGRARPELIDAVARPTRPAGRYSSVWDGRDDTGAPVGQGRYVVHVEVIREYGQHSYQTIPITLGATPTQAAAAAAEEIGATQVRYGLRR